MEYNNGISKITRLLDDTTNQRSKFRTRNWVEIVILDWRYDSSNIRFKKSMIRSHFYYYSDAYILVKGTIAVPNIESAGVAVNNTNKKVKMLLLLLIA